MENYKKSIECMLMSIIITMVLTINVSENVYAKSNYEEKNNNNEFESALNYEQMCNEFEYVNQKTNEELENNTGVIDEKLERELNEQGVLDEEIVNNLYSDLKKLDEDVENVKVVISYYAANDIEELKDEMISEDEMIELMPEQVDKYIAEEYYGLETNLNDELIEEFEKKNDEKQSVENESFIDNVLEKIGVKPVTVYAAKCYQYYYGGKDNKSNPTMLKKTAMLVQTAKGEEVNVIVHFVWTEMPKYRNFDLAYIKVNYAVIDGSRPINVRRYWTKIITNKSSTAKDYPNQKIIENVYQKKELVEYPLKDNNYSYDEKTIASAMNLYHKEVVEYPYYVTIDYENEGVCFDFYVKQSDMDYAEFTLNYSHTKVSLDIKSVLVNFSGGKFSILPATYNLLSGNNKEITTELSGAKANFKFTFK